MCKNFSFAARLHASLFFSRWITWLVHVHCGFFVLAVIQLGIASHAAARCKNDPYPPYLSNTAIGFHVVAAASNGKPMWPEIVPAGPGFVPKLHKYGPTSDEEYRTKYLTPL